MKVLVIGGSRFVGPSLLRLLSENGHQITVFNRGTRQRPLPSGASQVIGDREEGFGDLGRFDVVIDTCAYRKEHTERALKEIPSEHFIHVSSAVVYDRTNPSPYREDSPIGPWPLWGDYNRNKAEIERALESSGRRYSSLRPVYVLGAGNHIPREEWIYRSLSRGEPILMPGNGDAEVQFVFSEDVARALVLIAESGAQGAFNCAGDERISLVEFVRELARISEKEPHIVLSPENDGVNWDPARFPFPNETFLVSNDRLKSLGMSFTDLREGLRRDYETYYRQKATSV
jgi:nucleoside-diphosphate-sugar epimerase